MKKVAKKKKQNKKKASDADQWQVPPIEDPNFIPNIRAISFRYLFLPWFALVLGNIGIYSFLHWLLILKLNLFELDQTLVELIIPLCLPWIPAYLWLRKYLKILHFGESNKKWQNNYLFFGCLFIFLANTCTQQYLAASVGNFATLQNASEIIQVPDAKFFSIKNLYPAKDQIGQYTTRAITGKGSYLTFDHYISCPVYNSAADTNRQSSSIWFGVKYTHSFSTNLRDEEIKRSYDRLIVQCLENFKNRDLHKFTFLRKTAKNDDRSCWESAAINSLCKIASQKPIILEPIARPFEERAWPMHIHMYLVLGGSIIIWLVMVMLPGTDENEVRRLKNSQPQVLIRTSLLVRVKDIFYFNNFEGFEATLTLVSANVLIFMIMFFCGLGFFFVDPQVLIHWGGNYKPLVISGEWWRLISCIFLHGGSDHLVANMAALFYLGLFLERMIGKKTFATVYIISGVLASITSCYWRDASVAVGASGAIAGLAGFFMAILSTPYLDKDSRLGFLKMMGILIGATILASLKGRVDHAGHIGGFISGLILGFGWYLTRKEKKEVYY